MRNLLVALLLLSASAAFAQSQDDTSQRVRIIQQQVRAIGRDSLRRVDFSQAMQPPDTIRRPHLNFPAQYVAYYTPAGGLQELEIKQPMLYSFASADTHYYFVAGEVVYIDTDYVNASRMGSCGQIRFHNRYFVSQQQLLSAQLSEPPTGPYRSCYLVVPAEELAGLLQLLQPALAKVPVYQPQK